MNPDTCPHNSIISTEQDEMVCYDCGSVLKGGKILQTLEAEDIVDSQGNLKTSYYYRQPVIGCDPNFTDIKINQKFYLLQRSIASINHTELVHFSICQKIMTQLHIDSHEQKSYVFQSYLRIKSNYLSHNKKVHPDMAGYPAMFAFAIYLTARFCGLAIDTKDILNTMNEHYHRPFKNKHILQVAARSHMKLLPVDGHRYIARIVDQVVSSDYTKTKLVYVSRDMRPELTKIASSILKSIQHLQEQDLVNRTSPLVSAACSVYLAFKWAGGVYFHTDHLVTQASFAQAIDNRVGEYTIRSVLQTFHPHLEHILKELPKDTGLI